MNKSPKSRTKKYKCRRYGWGGRRKLRYIKIQSRHTENQPRKADEETERRGTYKELILLNLRELKSNIIKVGGFTKFWVRWNKINERPTWRMPLSIFKIPRLKAISRKLPERNTKECLQKETEKKKKNLTLAIFSFAKLIVLSGHWKTTKKKIQSSHNTGCLVKQIAYLKVGFQ